MKVEIYTDGAAKGNPGPGGYGVVLKYGSVRRELSAGYRRTTNNRMELLAVIRGLEALKNAGTEATVFSDSKYVVEAVRQKWVFGWEKTAFKKKKNADLWRQFLELYRRHRVDFVWIKGHNDHHENEECDRMAVAAAEYEAVNADEGYESGKYN